MDCIENYLLIPFWRERKIEKSPFTVSLQSHYDATSPEQENRKIQRCVTVSIRKTLAQCIKHKLDLLLEPVQFVNCTHSIKQSARWWVQRTHYERISSNCLQLSDKWLLFSIVFSLFFLPRYGRRKNIEFREIPLLCHQTCFM